MDPVRFGRALGTGARAAAKSLVQAADAASTPNPSARSAPRTAAVVSAPQAGAPRQATARSSQADARSADRAAAVQTQTVGRGIKEGARRFGREVWNPFARLSGVLWLEFTGVFFGIFALFALGAAIRLREAWHSTSANAGDHQRLLGAIAMFAVFGYFCISSFVRAKRRERGTR